MSTCVKHWPSSKMSWHVKRSGIRWTSISLRPSIAYSKRKSFQCLWIILMLTLIQTKSINRLWLWMKCIPMHGRNIKLCIANTMIQLFYQQSDFIPVTKTARSGKHGRLIQCPDCHVVFRIYHFAWTSIQCTNCKCTSPKLDYKMHKNPAA